MGAIGILACFENSLGEIGPFLPPARFNELSHTSAIAAGGGAEDAVPGAESGFGLALPLVHQA